MVIVRRLTLTILSMNGMSRIRPGPEPSPPGLNTALARRPNRKMTPRSYSRRMRTDEPITKITMTITGTMPKINSNPPIGDSSQPSGVLCPPRRPRHVQREAVHGRDLDRFPCGDRAVRRDRAPQLSVDHHLPFGGERASDDANAAYHPRRARRRRAVQRAHPGRHGEDHEPGHRAHGRDDDQPRDPDPRLRRVVEHER